MKKKLLSMIIEKMTNEELYAFVTATVMEIRRRSGASGDGLTAEDILSSIAQLISYVGDCE